MINSARYRPILNLLSIYSYLAWGRVTISSRHSEGVQHPYILSPEVQLFVTIEGIAASPDHEWPGS
jgi:hypothetical protein